MRVALCLFGLVGSKRGKSWNKEGGTDEVLQDCYKSFKKHFLDKNEIDVFFHTWDEEFESELVKKYNPKLYKTEVQKVFTDIVPIDSSRVQAHYSRWYSAKTSNNLKKEYESKNNFKYDFVMSSRFDMMWATDVVFENFDKDKFYIPRTTKGGEFWGWPYEWCHNEINDMWFFSNSKNMDKFLKLYDNINSYIKDGCPTFQGISNHMLTYWHLKKIGLLPEPTKGTVDNHVSLAFSDVSSFQLYRSYLKHI
jgi:hypothetical protein